jgi:uncharacterized protein YraI
MKRLAWLITTSLALALPAEAQVYDGFVVANVNLRAGPDVGYPPILVVPTGANVSIQGCIDGWSWCDVVVGSNRGWVAGSYIEEVYGDQRVVVADYGARIGIPIVAFTLGAYWGDHYRHHAWYNDRDRWEHRGFAHRPPPRPRGHGGGVHLQGPGHAPGHGKHHGGKHDKSRGHDDRRDGRHGGRDDDHGRGRGGRGDRDHDHR